MQLTPEQHDAIIELLNIGVGRAAGSLNQILDKPITLQIPSITLATAHDLEKILSQWGNQILSSVQLPFKGAYAGSATLAFPSETAPKLVEILTGSSVKDDELNAMKVATLTEIGNIVLNGVMGSMANVLSGSITYSVPMYNESSIKYLIPTSQSDRIPVVLWAQTRFQVTEHDISGDIFLMFDSTRFESLLNAINILTGQPT